MGGRRIKKLTPTHQCLDMHRKKKKKPGVEKGETVLS